MILGLEVNQDVGADQSRGDLLLELVGGAVGVLERGPGAELDVQIDVAAGAGPPGAELVIPDHPARSECFDRVADLVHLLAGQGLVDQHA